MVDGVDSSVLYRLRSVSLNALNVLFVNIITMLFV